MGPIGEEILPDTDDLFVLDDRTFLVDAGTRLDEINQRLDIDLPENADYETIAGLIMFALGRIPKVGEQYFHESIVLTVTQMSRVKIEKVRISLPMKPVDLGAGESIENE